MIEIELPFPPSVNHYWRHVGAKTLISRQGRAFRERVGWMMLAQRVKPLAGRLVLQVDLYPPDRRRRDVDNCLKALLDALQHGGAYADDSQIRRLVVEMREPVAAGMTIVRIRQVPT